MWCTFFSQFKRKKTSLKICYSQLPCLPHHYSFIQVLLPQVWTIVVIKLVSPPPWSWSLEADPQQSILFAWSNLYSSTCTQIVPFSQYTDFHGYSLNSRSSSTPQYGKQDLWDLSELLTYGFPIVLKQFPHLEYLPLLITSSLSFKVHFQAHLFHETFSDHSISPRTFISRITLVST